MAINLLIIDDDPIHHKLVELVVKHSPQSIELHAYFEAADAFCYILKNNRVSSLPDLILLDLDMPLVSGWGFLELFEAIGQNLERPVDVIILTSLIHSEIKEKAAKYSCVKGIFSKPFTDEMLQDILNSSFISANKNLKHPSTNLSPN